MEKSIKALLVLIFLLLYTSALFAEEKGPEKPWHRWNFDAGASWILNNSQVRLGAKGAGVEVNPQKLFGLEANTTVLRLSGNWRFTRNLRHSLDFTWYSNRRKGDTVANETIEIGDITINPGDSVKASLNIDVIRAGYTYSFFQDDRLDLAVGGGLYVMPIAFAVESNGVVQGSVSESFTAPLPVFSLRADIAITPKWFLRNRIDAFYLEYDNYKGGIVDTRIALEWEAFKHIGFGLAWDNFRLKVEAEDDTSVADFLGTFKFQNVGLMLYVKGYF
jgi:hypothetical protein